MSYGGGFDNYQTTSYGGGGGGGWNAGSQGGSQASPGKSASRNTIRSVTIKQILGANSPHDDATFLIDNIEIGQITFVAQVRDATALETNTTYKLEDGTGNIEVKQFPDRNSSGGGGGGMDEDDDGSSKRTVLDVNSYARVVGRLKQFGGKRNVTVDMIRPVTDFNEIQCHLLEATATHLYYTRGPPETLQSGGHQAAGGATSYKQEQDTDMGGVGNNAGAGATVLPPGISPNARKIFAVIKNRPDSSEGMHVALIAQEVKLQLTDVYKAVDELLTQGVCFTTMDDEHIACMDF